MKNDDGTHGEEPVRLNVLNGMVILAVSAAIITLQIVFMRSLAITRYYHFSYLVISTALLGFGMSGTLLTLFSVHFKKHFLAWSYLLILLFSISIPSSYYLAEKLQIDIRYILFSWHQVLLLFLYSTMLIVPFFLGALFLGLVLMCFEKKVPLVYGLNLFGSGIGGGLSLILLSFVHVTELPAWTGFALLAVLLSWLLSFREYRQRAFCVPVACVLVPGLAAGIFFLVTPFEINTDRYKAISHIKVLEDQGAARRVVSKISPRAFIDVYESGTFHNTLFAGPNAKVLPPEQLALLIDGNSGGNIFRINNASEAAILDYTPQSIAYRLVSAPKVLLLGEKDGVDVWLAKRFGAASVTVVQGNRKLIRTLLEDLHEESGGVLSFEGVRVVDEEPYSYLDRMNEKFDIIHIVEGEGVSSGVSGLQSLHENYLLTVETIAKCCKMLTEGGFITLTRGIQIPPRDNLKIFALFTEALEHAGIKQVKRHLLQARNYLAVNTMIAKSAVEKRTVSEYRNIADRLLLDIEYYPGIDDGSEKQINRMNGPEGKAYSYLHYGIQRILSTERNNFFREWPYSVSPPTDDRPYFYDFFKWRSLGAFMKTYGSTWLQHLEVGYIVLVASLSGTFVTALICTLLPLFLFKRKHLREGNAGVVIVYFSTLGIGFMFIEMVFIHKFTRFLGDPIYSATATIISVLIFAGVGSMMQSGEVMDRVRRVRHASIAVVAILVFYLVALERALAILPSMHVAIRFLVLVAVLSPLSFFMGWMFPNGMSILEKESGNLVPWAWGINGFASVIAAPLSVMVSMSFGFHTVMIIAAILYLLSGYMIGFMNAQRFGEI